MSGRVGGGSRDHARSGYSRRTMTDLTPDQVRALATAEGLSLTDDDLAEITHRVNAFVDALTPLGRLPLDTVEPLPVSPEPE